MTMIKKLKKVLTGVSITTNGSEKSKIGQSAPSIPSTMSL